MVVKWGFRCGVVREVFVFCLYEVRVPIVIRPDKVFFVVVILRENTNVFQSNIALTRKNRFLKTRKVIHIA